MNTRRKFLRVFMAVVASLSIWPTRVALAKKYAVSLDMVAKLKKVGGWTILKLKGRKVLLIRAWGVKTQPNCNACKSRQLRVSSLAL